MFFFLILNELLSDRLWHGAGEWAATWWRRRPGAGRSCALTSVWVPRLRVPCEPPGARKRTRCLYRVGNSVRKNRAASVNVGGWKRDVYFVYVFFTAAFLFFLYFFYIFTLIHSSFIYSELTMLIIPIPISKYMSYSYLQCTLKTKFPEKESRTWAQNLAADETLVCLPPSRSPPPFASQPRAVSEGAGSSGAGRRCLGRRPGDRKANVENYYLWFPLLY